MTSYAEYLTKNKSKKINPSLLAPATAKVPGKKAQRSRYIQPPLDMKYTKTKRSST